MGTNLHIQKFTVTHDAKFEDLQGLNFVDLLS